MRVNLITTHRLLESSPCLFSASRQQWISYISIGAIAVCVIGYLAFRNRDPSPHAQDLGVNKRGNVHPPQYKPFDGSLKPLKPVRRVLGPAGRRRPTRRPMSERSF